MWSTWRRSAFKLSGFGCEAGRFGGRVVGDELGVKGVELVAQRGEFVEVREARADTGGELADASLLFTEVVVEPGSVDVIVGVVGWELMV